MNELVQELITEAVHDRARAMVGEEVGYYWEMAEDTYPVLEVFFRSTPEQLAFYETKLRRFLLQQGIETEKADVSSEQDAKEEGIHRLYLATDFTKITEKEFLFMRNCLRIYGRRYEDVC